MTARASTSLAAWAVLVALPLLGLWLLLARPELDVAWENHPAHFWLVLAVAVVNLALALLTSEAARRRADARVFLVSLAIAITAGFFALHALATPGVVLPEPNAGFVIATPVGLLLAAVLAVASSFDWPRERAVSLMRRERMLRGGLLLVLVAWAVASLAEVGPLDEPLSEDVATPALVGFALVGCILYAVAGARYFELHRERRSPLLLAVVTALALLAEAMIAIAFARSWHATWWEWHVLLLLAFGLVAWGARREWRTEGTSGEIFSDLYLEETRGRREDVSVIFADLQGFTAYSERTAPEEVKRMLDAYFGAAAPVVAKHGGRIDKTIGDALMAVFGDDDHASRATRAALELQERTAEIAAANEGWPRFRAGVNSGEALVGLVDARGGRSFTVTGDVVNLAARLETAARAGEVVVGAGTHARLPPDAQVTPLGRVDVKGKEAPVEAFLVRALPPE